MHFILISIFKMNAYSCTRRITTFRMGKNKNKLINDTDFQKPHALFNNLLIIINLKLLKTELEKHNCGYIQYQNFPFPGILFMSTFLVN